MRLSDFSDESWEPTGFEGPPSRQQILKRAFESVDRERRACRAQQSCLPQEREDDLPVSPLEQMRMDVQAEASVRNRRNAIRLIVYACLLSSVLGGMVWQQAHEQRRARAASGDNERSLPQNREAGGSDLNDSGWRRDSEAAMINKQDF